MFCILNTERELSKAPTGWISLSLLSRSLPCIFHLNSKYVILPTDVHPLFPLAYQELQSIAEPDVFLNGLVKMQAHFFGEIII